MTTERPHGLGRYKKGPDENGQPGKGCRCGICREADREYDTNRTRQIAYGRWQPLVDAELVRAHVHMLARNGVSYKRIAALSGVPAPTINGLLWSKNDRPGRKVRAETAARILGVQMSPDHQSARMPIDATGTRRRLQALVAVGYSQRGLATLLRVKPATLKQWLTSDTVVATRAKDVRVLYDKIWDVPPPRTTHREKSAATRALNFARLNNWPPPMAWDDDQIDDPASKSAPGWKRRDRLPTAEIAAEAAELIPQYGGSRELAAQRLGIKRATLDTILVRTARRAS